MGDGRFGGRAAVEWSWVPDMQPTQSDSIDRTGLALWRCLAP
jgi:hypothetical protein